MVPTSGGISCREEGMEGLLIACKDVNDIKLFKSAFSAERMRIQLKPTRLSMNLWISCNLYTFQFHSTTDLISSAHQFSHVFFDYHP